MGVYIKGMEMPTGRDTLVLVRTNGTAIVYEDEAYASTAVPVLPHGRLIEKHDVFKLIRSFPNVDRLLPVDFMKALYELPTIIPAEEG